MLTALALLAAMSPSFVDVDGTCFGGMPVVRGEIAPGKSALFALDTGSPRNVYNGKLEKGWSGPAVKIGDASVNATSERNKAMNGLVNPQLGIKGLLGVTFLQDKQLLTDPYHKGRVALRIGAALDAAEAEKALRAADPFQEGRSLAMPTHT